MKKTLVIHPKDETTDCLSVIYEGRGWDVIRDYNTPRKEVEEAIKSHDRIIMLGHGTPEGLLAGGMIKPGLFTRFHHYIVDDDMAELLEGKETFSIWCNSDQYFRRYNLKGLHTKMIISEISEEYVILKCAPLDSKEMAENMELFCGAFAKYIDLEPEEMQKKVLEEYAGSDPVTMYNRDNIIIL